MPPDENPFVDFLAQLTTGHHLTSQQISELTAEHIADLVIAAGEERAFAEAFQATTGKAIGDPTIGMTEDQITELKTSLVQDGFLAHPEEMPTMSQLNARVSKLVQDEGEWAGAPALIDHQRLVLEPRYPHQKLNGQSWQTLTGAPEDEPLSLFYRLWSAHPKCNDEHVILNFWYYHKWNSEVYICGEQWPYHNTRVPIVRYPIVISSTLGSDKMDYWFSTMMASKAWTVQAELRALQKLSGIIPEHKFCSYLTTGAFLETSPKSKVKYMFRRARPTLAFSIQKGMVQFLAALCAHPIGYYQGTWAGTMVPTDDVIAHLMLMRACEHKFWGKCNHHPVHDALAGI